MPVINARLVNTLSSRGICPPFNLLLLLPPALFRKGKKGKQPDPLPKRITLLRGPWG
jgi:hypothetical protein